ncbi:unnamed protein product, partial [Discosporangium mesarthrocarpum]
MTPPPYSFQTDLDKLGARYTGKGNHEADVGVSRSDHPLPRFQRAFYFEARVVSAGSRGKVCIGLVGEHSPLNRQPGTDACSYGFRGDDGKVYRDSPCGRDFAPNFSTDDTVGLGVNFATREIFLTLNGCLLGVAFRSVSNSGLLYPCVSLHSPGESVRLNFGRDPFTFDLRGFLA